MKTSITHIGQKYVDEPVYAEPKRDLRTPIAEALADLFGHTKVVTNNIGAQVKTRTDIPTILLRHDHVRLRWMKPGPDGKLIPR